MSWPMVKLGDVAPSRPLKNPKIEDTERVWQLNLDMVEANSGQVIEKCYQSLGEAGSSTHWFDANHVLYSKLRPYLNKVVTPDEQGLATTELVPLLPDPKRLDRHFLAYYLRSSEFVQWISEQVAGAKMPRVSMDLFWNHEIPLPPLAEQKRIAAILDKADAIRRKRQQAIQLADDFLRAVFLEMFGDPVTNPKGWEVKPLKDVLKSISSGWSANGDSRPCEEGELGVLKISAVTSGAFIPTENKAVQVSDIPSSKKLVFPKKGDMLFSRANTRELVAASCIVVEDSPNTFLPDKLWLIKTDESQLLPEYLNYLLKIPGFKEKLTSQATGSSGSMLNISMSKFGLTECLVPPINLQHRFKNMYWKLQETLSGFEESESTLKKSFNALSQKAFSGQL